MKNTVFSVGLRDQFANYRMQFPNLELEDFARLYFSGKEQTVYFSYPNFDRVKKSDEKAHGQYYNNVAARFPQNRGKNDIVLMGDIFERDRNNHRTFRVKAILTIDPQSIPSGIEIKVDGCCPVVRLSRSSNWECGEEYSEYPTDRQVSYSTLTNDFMLSLNKNYVVKDPRSVKEQLDLWGKYLMSRKYLIDEASKKGYELGDCIPQVIMAYSTEKSRVPENSKSVEFLETDRQSVVWTTDQVTPESKEGVLLHLYITRNQKEVRRAEGKSSEKKKFDGFTRSPMVIVDPTIAVNEKNRSKNQIIQIRDGRIAPSFTEVIPPEKELKDLDKECERRLDKASKDVAEEFKRDVRARLDQFVARELPEIIRKEVSEQEPAITKRITVSCEKQKEAERTHLNSELLAAGKSRKEAEQELRRNMGAVREYDSEITAQDKVREEIDSVLRNQDQGDGKESEIFKKYKAILDELSRLKNKKTVAEASVKKIEERTRKMDTRMSQINKDLAGLDVKYDPAKLIEAELANLSSKISQRETSQKKAELEELLEPEYRKEEKSRKDEIGEDIDRKKKTAVEDLTLERYHIYFELEVSETEKAEAVVKAVAPKMKPGMFLRKDFTGDWVVIDRQQKALGSLREGYVMNPFLATSLYSPETAVVQSTVNVDNIRFFAENLNDKQKESVARALNANGVFLLQGPPGTGKTQVIAEITAQYASQGRKVLIASENNKAVDNAFSRLPKIPVVRPMRILSEHASAKNDSNPYSMKKLLENFYGNISSSLDKEQRKYANHEKYMDDLNECIEKLQMLSDKISRYDRETANVQARLDNLREELDALYVKKSKAEEKGINILKSLAEQDEKIEDIMAFEDEYVVDHILEELAEIGFDPKKYGRSAKEVLKILAEAENGELEVEYVNMIVHQELFDLKTQKAKETAPKAIVELNKKIEKYLEFNDIDESELFPVLRRFTTIPDEETVVKAKEIVDNVYEENLQKYNTARSRLDKTLDTSTVDVLVEQIERKKDEIEEVREDDAFEKMQSAIAEFDRTVKEILVDLNLVYTYSSPEQVIEKLKSVRANMERELKKDGSSRADKIEVYRRIVKYLRDEKVIEADDEVYRSDLLKTVNVFGMTCTTGDRFTNTEDEKVRLNELNIDVVIIDEVSKVPFVELLQPILYGKTVILVGDHKQLPPMYTERLSEEEMGRYDPQIINEEDEKKYKEMYEESFFKTLFEKTPSTNKIMLTVQYRMHSDIMGVDNVFYGNKLEAGANDASKEHYLDITGAYGKKIIGKDTHVLFIDVKGREVQESGSKSYINEAEANVVRNLLNTINRNCKYDRNGRPLTGFVDKHNDERLSVGVICPYADQARLIRGKKTERYNSFNNSSDEKFMVKSVDDFQGDERDIIILSLVRTTSKARFLKDFRRINVAVSRARRLLIIVGNRKALEPMRVDLGDSSKGTSIVPVYKNIISTIEKKNAILTENSIIGGE